MLASDFDGIAKMRANGADSANQVDITGGNYFDANIETPLTLNMDFILASQWQSSVDADAKVVGTANSTAICDKAFIAWTEDVTFNSSPTGKEFTASHKCTYVAKYASSGTDYPAFLLAQAGFV